MKAHFAALLALLALAGCGENMDNQNRLKTYGSVKGLKSWPSQSEAVPLVKGTVSQNALADERAVQNPPDVNLAFIERGHQRYDIYCSACHGLTGAGDGIVVARGFPRPKPFHDPTLMTMPARQLVDSISNGYGKMYGFSDRVGPRDRWAIVAYIRALQIAENGSATK